MQILDQAKFEGIILQSPKGKSFSFTRRIDWLKFLVVVNLSKLNMIVLGESCIDGVSK